MNSEIPFEKQEKISGSHTKGEIMGYDYTRLHPWSYKKKINQEKNKAPTTALHQKK